MNLKISEWDSLSLKDRQKIFKRSEIDISQVRETVAGILQQVQQKGDQALRELTLKYDNVDLNTLPIQVTQQEFDKAEKNLSPALKESLEQAISNVKAISLTQMPKAMEMVQLAPGLLAGEKASPIKSAGLYVPRGRGNFPSMLYMTAVPAVTAGVKRVCITTPPGKNGLIDDACLVAARLCGLDEVYRIGGAQGIAALAYGTESIDPVVKITGPGSVYVTAAKHLLFGSIDVGLLAGPSEAIVLTDEHSDPWKIALDLLVEAEHGSDSSVLLLTTSASLAHKVTDHITKILPKLSEQRRKFVIDVLTGYGGLIVTKNMEQALDIVNTYAPEHLSIRMQEPFSLLDKIQNAGEILIGDNVPFSMANYLTGVNAVLPTGGNAMTSSPVSVRDFIKYSSVVYATTEGYNSISEHTVRIAEYEGFETHANAILLRNENR